MKKLILIVYSIFCCMFLVCCGGDKANMPKLRSDKIYFFYQNNCPHCHNAADYINQKYPNVKMEKIDIANKDGMDLFLKCAQKFSLGKRIGTPLFCIGSNYIMGWDKEYQRRFDYLVQNFIKTNK